MYYLDTNACIYFLNGRSESIKDKILNTAPNDIAIPSIVKAELILGAYKSQFKERTLEKLEKFLQPFEIIPFEDQVTYQYAQIRTEVENIGQTIGPNDLLIASIAKFHDAILITNNIKEFERIRGLKLENWF